LRNPANKQKQKNNKEMPTKTKPVWRR